MEITANGISVMFQDLENPVGNTVQGKVLLPGGIISSVILKSHRISQNIGSQFLSVSVKNISAGAVDGTFFCNTGFKFADVILPLNDLQFKKLLHQDTGHENKYYNKYGCPFYSYFLYKSFYFSTQIDSLSFFNGLIR